MKVGDLIRFKKTGNVGTIVGKIKGSHYTMVDVLHNVKNVQNPSGFTLGELRKTAEIINESR